jgi:hypothetical protein
MNASATQPRRAVLHRKSGNSVCGDILITPYGYSHDTAHDNAEIACVPKEHV